MLLSRLRNALAVKAQRKINTRVQCLRKSEYQELKSLVHITFNFDPFATVRLREPPCVGSSRIVEKASDKELNIELGRNRKYLD